MENLNLFQVYSGNNKNALNILVDKIWIEDNRIYFRILEKISNFKCLKKEKDPKIYSIDQSKINSIRCKLYF